MNREELALLAESYNYELARGVLGVIEVIENKSKRYFASVPFHIVAHYSNEDKKYIALERPYTVYTYFCEPDLDIEVEIPLDKDKSEVFSIDILQRMSSFNEYISKVLLLFDYNTRDSKLGIGHAFYAFVRKLPYTEFIPNHNGIDKRWFRRNLYTGNHFLNISPFEITAPTEKSIEFATRRDSETQGERIKLVNLHARTASVPFDVRQKVSSKNDRQANPVVGIDW